MTNHTPAGFADITDYSPNALTAFLTASSDAIAAGASPSEARQAGVAAADSAHAEEPTTVADIRPSDLALTRDYVRYTLKPTAFTF